MTLSKCNSFREDLFGAECTLTPHTLLIHFHPEFCDSADLAGVGRRRSATSSCRHYSYDFLLLGALLLLQAPSPERWMRTAALLCSTSEDFGISSAGVRWQLLLRMGYKCGSFVSPVGICVCAHACVCMPVCVRVHMC